MIRDLGIIPPGTTLYVPFHTFDSNDPSASVTLTGLATSDVEIYKDGSTTQRASDAGYALLDTDGIDFDGVTGIHGLSIDLADNTTAGFYAAGSQYWVVVSSVTVDAATINFVLCTFRIGYPDSVLNTTIASLTNQTSFTLTAGPAEDDALNGCVVLIHDVASAVQKGFAVVSDYTGSTKTVTLTAGTTFTVAATDNISFFPPANAGWGGAVAYSTTRGLAGTALPNAAADAAGGLPISDAGGLDLDAKIGALTYGTANRVNAQVYGVESNAITAAGVAADVWTEGRTAINGGDYALSTDTNGRIRIVDGTGTGELDTSSGAVLVGDFTTAAKALLQTEAEDALVAHRLDELLNADSDIDGAAPPTVGSVFHELMSKTAGSFTYDQTTDSNEAIRDRGDAAWVTATGFSTHSAADVWAVATRVLTAGTNIQLPSNGLANVTAWTVDVTGNITGNLSGSVGSVTGAVGSVTGNVGGNVAGSVGSVTGAVGSVTGNVGGNVTGSVGSLAAQAKADVNAEVLDVLNVDTLIDGKTIAQALIYCGAGIAGRVSGAGTGTEVFKGLDEATTRLTVTVDSSGNRTDIVYG